MPQCQEYPNSCQGLVIQSTNNEWFCEKHYYTLERMISLGEKKLYHEKA